MIDRGIRAESVRHRVSERGPESWELPPQPARPAKRTANNAPIDHLIILSRQSIDMSTFSLFSPRVRVSPVATRHETYPLTLTS